MHPGRRRVARLVLLSAGALVLLPLAVAAVVRLLALDDRSSMAFALQSLTPFLYLPAYVVLVVALLARAKVLTAAAAVLVALHVAWVAPDLGASDVGRAAGPRLEVVAASPAATNTSPAAVARLLLSSGADVLVVSELTPRLRDELDAAGVATRYPHRLDDAREGFFGSGVYSAFPLRSSQRFDLAGLPAVRTEVLVGDVPVSLVGVHTIQPLADHDRLVAQLRALADLARTSTGPLVMAGDFNASSHNTAFRRLLGTRLRDAHRDRGRGLARTWPAHLPVPPFTLIDHVLVSDELAVLGVGEFGIVGSDHRGVRARLQLR